MICSLAIALCLQETQFTYEVRDVEGWKLSIRNDVDNKSEVSAAIKLLRAQLKEVVRVVPAPAVKKLKEVPLFFCKPFPGSGQGAAYHPSIQWLRDNKRDPIMARSVEFTNVSIFELETKRMPNFALHELAHAYHDRVLPGGFGNADLKTAFERAVASGSYESVDIRSAEGVVRKGKYYGLNNPMEFFAEATEAYFSRNDMFPFDRKDLEAHDPETARLVGRLWGAEK